MSAERDQAEIVILAETFRLLGDPTRLRIMLYCLSEPKSVGEIVEGLGLSQSLVSHHLRLLRGSRLVEESGRQSRSFIRRRITMSARC